MKNIFQITSFKICLVLLLALSHAACEMQKSEGRYQVLADGSEVKDKQTGLVWARCSVGQDWAGDQCVGEAKKFKFAETQQSTNNGWLKNGWRLPTGRELASLRFCSAGYGKEVREISKGEFIPAYCKAGAKRPTIDQSAFPQTPNNLFWSSSPIDSYGHIRTVGFDDGGINGGHPTFLTIPVRLLRDSQ